MSNDSNAIFLIVSFNEERLKAFRPSGQQTIESLRNHSFLTIREKFENVSEDDLKEAQLKIIRFLPEFNDWEDISCNEQLVSGGKIIVEILQNRLQVVNQDQVIVVQNEEESLPFRPTSDSMNFMQTPKSSISSPEPSLLASQSAAGSTNSLAAAGCNAISVTKSKMKYLFKDSQAYDLDAILASCNEATKKLIATKFTEKSMGEPGSGFEEARVALVSICGQHLLRQAYANAQEKPTAIEKARMAFSIWLKYQFYKQKKTGGFPYGKLYDPVKNGGYLENYVVNQVRNVKRKLYAQDSSLNSNIGASSKKSKNATKSAPAVQLNSDELAIKLRDLNRAAPDGNPVKSHDEILQKMDDLYEYRRNWIGSDESVRPEHILAKFPCLGTMPALLLGEFEHIMADLDLTLPDMDLRWTQAVKFIIEDGMSRYKSHTMVKNLLEMFSLPDTNAAKKLSSELKGNLALQLLPVMLKPRTFNSGKAKEKKLDKIPVVHAITYLIQHKKVCDNKPVRSVIDDAKKDKGLTQPFLMALTPYGGEGENAAQIFVVVDYTPIEVPKASYLSAVKYLFASFFVFDTDYPNEALGQVYEFFEYLFGVKNNVVSKSKKCRGNSAEELFDRLTKYTENAAETDVTDDELEV